MTNKIVLCGFEFNFIWTEMKRKFDWKIFHNCTCCIFIQLLIHTSHSIKWKPPNHRLPTSTKPLIRTTSNLLILSSKLEQTTQFSHTTHSSSHNYFCSYPEPYYLFMILRDIYIESIWTCWICRLQNWIFSHRQLQPSLLSPFLLNFVQVTPYFSIIFHT